MNKVILVVVGTVGLVNTTADAGTKKTFKKPVELAAVAKPDVTVTELPAAPELLAIPDLPRDTSSALVPFPELENERVIPVKPTKPRKQKAPVMNFGKKYILGGRQAQTVKPQDTQQIVLKSLSQAQVAMVVQSHMGDIQSCWNAVPKAERADACTADLKLQISEAGAVTDIEIGAEVPAAARRCMSAAIGRWAFPLAETTSDVEYGISLRSL